MRFKAVVIAKDLGAEVAIASGLDPQDRIIEQSRRKLLADGDQVRISSRERGGGTPRNETAICSSARIESRALRARRRACRLRPRACLIAPPSRRRARNVQDRAAARAARSAARKTGGETFVDRELDRLEARIETGQSRLCRRAGAL